MNLQRIVQLLKQGKIGVILTDTIYGIVGSAFNTHTVQEIYRLRKRAFNKPMIILISDLNDLNHFNIKLTNKQKKFLNNVWPNPVSVILPCPFEKFNYLHRGTNSLAFRIPKNEKLMEILKKVGPLVAPSANFEGQKPSETIDGAKKYFGNKVAFYTDGSEIKTIPSTLIELRANGSWKILRQGGFRMAG